MQWSPSQPYEVGAGGEGGAAGDYCEGERIMNDLSIGFAIGVLFCMLINGIADFVRYQTKREQAECPTCGVIWKGHSRKENGVDVCLVCGTHRK